MSVPISQGNESSRLGIWRDIFAAHFSVNIAIELQYRASALIWILSAMMESVIALVVWSTVARQSGGSVNGMSPGYFAAYFVTAMFVARMTVNWLNWVYEEYIREGSLAARLLRPLHPVVYDFMSVLSNKAFQVVVVLPTAMIVAWIFSAEFHFQAWSLAAAVPAMVLAFFVRFTLEWTVALAAFWTTRMGAINLLYFNTFIIFSGMLAPLSLYPPAIQAISWMLPWRWTIYFPVQLILGELSPREAAIGLGMQLFWFAALAIVARMVWKKSITKFSSVGG